MVERLCLIIWVSPNTSLFTIAAQLKFVSKKINNWQVNGEHETGHVTPPPPTHTHTHTHTFFFLKTG